MRAPRGTRDLLPPESWVWEEVLGIAAEVFSHAGYAPIETPIFEHTEVFERGVGQSTEVVGKQMYTFQDRADRSLTLRPEGTAPVMRAVLEHGLHRGPLPVKLRYAGPMFRQERPQKGRYRQFFQVGIEAIGSDDPRVDAEVIEVGQRFYREAGVTAHLKLNSIGHLDASCRIGYIETLRSFLESHRSDLAPEDVERSATNPLRTFDSKEEATRAVTADAPRITNHLCSACSTHFESVRGYLDSVGVAYELDPTLVRGLDYYTRTAFEWVSEGLGSQDAVGGGGRYDGLSESLGGPPLPGIGIAPGVDRIVLARSSSQRTIGPSAYLVGVGEEAQREAFRLAARLRARGVATELDLLGRGLKGQMKDAARTGARWAVILGDDELKDGTATVKNLERGEQETVPIERVEEMVRG